MNPFSKFAIPVALLSIPFVPSAELDAQQVEFDAERWVEVLEHQQPALAELLTTIEQAQWILLGGLAREGDEVREEGSGLPSFDFEFDMYDRLVFHIEDRGIDVRTEDIDAGHAALGSRGTEVVERTNELYRVLLGIYLDPDAGNREQAVNQAIDHYLSRPEVALPSVPKDMDILYDHPYTWAFKSGYPDLIGVTWAGHWLQLAAVEPVMDSRNEDELRVGLDTVMARYERKLAFGEAPNTFPEELPLAPSIVPGLVARHPRAGAIFDNLNMMYDVVADVLVAPEVDDVRATVDQTIDQFLDPDYRTVPRNDWIVMALRHSIFLQGGPALGVMTRTERNADGHAQHLQGGGQVILPGMP
jgi:hypothetical protein